MIVVSLSKNINPSLVLVQPRKTCPYITERFLMGRKESNKKKTQKKDEYKLKAFCSVGRNEKCLHPDQQVVAF